MTRIEVIQQIKDNSTLLMDLDYYKPTKTSWQLLVLIINKPFKIT